MGPNFDYYCILCVLTHRIIWLLNIKNKFFDLILALITIALYVLASNKLVLQTTLILCEVTHRFVWLFQHKKKLPLSILTLSFSHMCLQTSVFCRDFDAHKLMNPCESTWIARFSKTKTNSSNYFCDESLSTENNIPC